MHRRSFHAAALTAMFGPAAAATAAFPAPAGWVGAAWRGGQAVVVACYEWFMSLHQPPHAGTGEEGAQEPAPRGQLSGLLDQLEGALDAVNFWRVPEKKETMWRNIRATLVRARLNVQEIATWRGLVKALRGE
ncbi:MAG: hypothetical protein J0L58_19985 [Burkholderiales bacterium]|nr:hypothetical protein [Burkholderiales bacterium]